MKHRKRIKLTHNEQQNAIDALMRIIKTEGTQKKFAEMVNSHQSQVSRWLDGMPMKAEKAVEIEELFGIDRSILRPDLFNRRRS